MTDMDVLRRRYATQHVLARIGVYTAAVIAAFLCAGPFVWSAITALKQNRDLYNPVNNPFTFTRPATPDHVTYLFTDTAFGRFAWNTLWVGILVVAITLLFGLPAAYALSRLDRAFFSSRYPASSSAWDCRTQRGRWCWSIRPSPSRYRRGC
jgi:multiple sugar transport system permease protein